MERLSATNSLVVAQQKEWGEILSGFEGKNRYTVSDEFGSQLYLAVEESGSTILRWFLRAHRPFKVAVLGGDGAAVLRVVRPFRFYFHQAEVIDAEGRSLGTIVRRFSILRRRYSVVDGTGRETFQLFGPLLRPWTFRILQDWVEVGKITKKWSGLLKEGFSDADNFCVLFPAEWDVRRKALFLGAVFLIDFVHFENKNDD